MNDTGFIFDKAYLRHSLCEGHPECPARLVGIIDRLKEKGLLDHLRVLPPSEVDPLESVFSIHTKVHRQMVLREAMDESICLRAVAGAMAGVDAVCRGGVRNAFCALRPPGHHAVNAGEFGFCFYNNIAIAARYAQRRYGLRRVLIVDWDYHHGNGTESAFYEDDTVLFFSTHRLEVFPGTGYPERTGKGVGKGFNINVALPRGADDDLFLKTFRSKLIPAAERFRPEIILISAGFDAREGGPVRRLFGNG